VLGVLCACETHEASINASMKKSPSALFSILSEGDDGERRSRARQSLDDIRASVRVATHEPRSEMLTRRRGRMLLAASHVTTFHNSMVVSARALVS
jgi:hypothetical protein